MPRKKVAAPAAAETTENVSVAETAEAVPTAEAAESAPKTRAKRSSKAAAAKAAPAKTTSGRHGRPPLSPEVYVEYGSKQYNISDIIERAKADYRAAHKVGVQSCKVYVKPEEGMAYYVVNKEQGKLEL